MGFFFCSPLFPLLLPFFLLPPSAAQIEDRGRLIPSFFFFPLPPFPSPLPSFNRRRFFVCFPPFLPSSKRWLQGCIQIVPSSFIAFVKRFQFPFPLPLFGRGKLTCSEKGSFSPPFPLFPRRCRAARKNSMVSPSFPLLPLSLYHGSRGGEVTVFFPFFFPPSLLPHPAMALSEQRSTDLFPPLFT